MWKSADASIGRRMRRSEREGGENVDGREWAESVSGEERREEERERGRSEETAREVKKRREKERAHAELREEVKRGVEGRIVGEVERAREEVAFHVIACACAM
eukprot:1592394-Rhodomonas_salina.1